MEADKATQSTAEEAAAESIHSSIETHQAHLAHKAARTRLHTHAQTLTDASTDWTKAREKLRPSVPLDVPKTLGARTAGEETAAAVRERILSAAAPLPVTWHSSPKDLVSWADGKEVGGTGATRGSSPTQTSAYVPQEQEQEEEHEYDSRPDAPPHAPTHALETAAQRLALWAEVFSLSLSRSLALSVSLSLSLSLALSRSRALSLSLSLSQTHRHRHLCLGKEAE